MSADDKAGIPAARSAWRVWAAACAALVVALAAVALGAPGALGGSLPLCVVAPIAVMAAFGISAIRAHRRQVKAATDRERRGDLAGAAAVFEVLATDPNEGRRNAALGELGRVELLRGHVDRALTLLVAADRATQASAPGIARYLALGHALRGDVGAAEKWLAEAVRRSGKQPAPWALYCEILLAARRGDCARVEELCGARWREAEAQLTGTELRHLRLVRAFALAAEGADPLRIAPHLAAARAGHPDDYRFLVAAWPELAAFVTAQS